MIIETFLLIFINVFKNFTSTQIDPFRLNSMLMQYFGTPCSKNLTCLPCNINITMEINVQPVENYNFTNNEDFQAFSNIHRKPLVIKNFDIGQCKKKWTVDYLTQSLGNVDVKVHLSPVGQMNFIHKNFTYKTMSFEEFLFRSSKQASDTSIKTELKPILCENEMLYLRAIGSDRRGKNVANFKNDFPQIADDFVYPDLFESSRFFSSVFRIASAGIQIWTHYDVMDNALVQISGTKRVVLFSPDDAPCMYLNGDKSEVTDIDHPNISIYPEFLKAVQHECVLEPGDILYIPAFWFHNVLCHTFSIGINVFWKNLDPDMYDKNDVYGNKDIVPAAKALDHINKAANIVKSLPKEYQMFYLNRCISELKKVLEKQPQCLETKKIVHNKEANENPATKQDVTSKEKKSN